MCVCCLYECENWGLDLPQFTQALTPQVQSIQSLAWHHWQTFLHPQDHQGPYGCAWQWAIPVTLSLFYISLRHGLSGSFALHEGPYCHASHISRWRRRQGSFRVKGQCMCPVHGVWGVGAVGSPWGWRRRPGWHPGDEGPLLSRGRWWEVSEDDLDYRQKARLFQYIV